MTPLLRLRVLISFLGEKSQFNWWQSDFFAPTASAFLAPLFPRTRFLSQVEGSAAAAGKLHDERIGVGRVFHLFRLPEDFEQSFHASLQHNELTEELSALLGGRGAAMEALESEFGEPSQQDTGPVLVGNSQALTDAETLARMGQAYLSGFKTSTPVFPYLKDE